ncbi:MAG: acyltransferase [Campylobacterota bacterium]|nr:acyltransferase [Campylobacterota bacterium]
MRLLRKLKQKTIYYLFKLPRILKYKFLSTAKNIDGKPIINQAVQFNGLGKINFGKNVMIGIEQSPLFYSTYSYIESRNSDSTITIADDCFINNNAIMIAEGEGIEISAKCLIGINCEIVDSDFHNIEPDLRLDIKSIKTAKVVLEENVFIGSNVKILKGVRIGKNSVIANSSVVTKSIPADVVAGGIPAKVLKNL